MDFIAQVIVTHGFLYWNVLIVYGNSACPNGTDDIQWKTTTKSTRGVRRFSGEWILRDCRVKNLNVVAQLFYGVPPTGQPKIVDGRKVINNDNEFNLTNISQSDDGEYYCHACGKNKTLKKLVLDTGGKAFQYPRIVSKPYGKIHFGANVKLICKYPGFGYISGWYKDKVISERKLDFTSSSGSLQYDIKHFTKTSEGLYICHIRRPVVRWTALDQVLLQMHDIVKPSFQNFPNETIYLNEGEMFNWKILVTGSPKPDVNCSKNDKDKVEIEKNGSLVLIQIHRVMYSQHNGTEINCNATNINGSVSRFFWLNVLVKPKISGKIVPYKTTTLTSKGLNLTCKIDEANPAASIKWEKSFKYDENETHWSGITTKDSTGHVNEDRLLLKNQESHNVFYRCIARNRVGTDHFVWLVYDDTKRAGHPSPEKSTSSYLVVIIVVSIVIFLLLLLVTVVLFKRKRMYGGFYIFTLPPEMDYIKILDKNKFVHEQWQKLPYLSEWEFPRQNVLLREELGSGAFGVVYLADAIGISSFHPRKKYEKKGQRRFSLERFRRKNTLLLDQVVIKTAVKALKEKYTQSDLEDIQSELKILIHVGEHENIVKILGASTKGDHYQRPLIILEYCPHGNLKGFLRSRRDIYIPEWKQVDNMQLSITDLVLFSYQIAQGMSFLISRKCIHRDLAARNILVGEGYVAKISDFGLARDVCHNREYLKVTTGLLPIKWMALEAIRDRIFNPMTDVWSYGIVLWEIFTLGGTPYPDLDPSRVIETLVDGERMSPPMLCPKEMTDLMLSCWRENPSERPSFLEIVETFNRLCEGTSSHETVVYQNFPYNDQDADGGKVEISIS